MLDFNGDQNRSDNVIVTDHICDGCRVTVQWAANHSLTLFLFWE